MRRLALLALPVLAALLVAPAEARNDPMVCVENNGTYVLRVIVESRPSPSRPWALETTERLNAGERPHCIRGARGVRLTLDGHTGERWARVCQHAFEPVNSQAIVTARGTTFQHNCQVW